LLWCCPCLPRDFEAEFADVAHTHGFPWPTAAAPAARTVAISEDPFRWMVGGRWHRAVENHFAIPPVCPLTSLFR